MQITEGLRIKASAWIRDLQESNAEPPNIHSNVLKTLEKGLPNYNPIQKQLILLKNISRSTVYPGMSIPIVPRNDFPLAWASCEKELTYYLRTLVDRGLLDHPSKEHPDINELLNVVQISSLGWEYLDKHSGKSEISDQVFVAMSFSENMTPIWLNAIKPGIEDAGYKAYRVDSTPHSDRIDIKIMAEIKSSRFLIADVTEQKQGVYFEAGYAIGLGIPVIWSCKKEDFKNVHFDTKQYNHIRWANETDLKEQLYSFISVIIGKRKSR